MESALLQFSGTCPTSCQCSQSIQWGARDSNRWRKITAAEALKKLDEVKNSIEINGSDHLNMIFNESIKNVEQIKLKNKKQSDITSLFSSKNIFYLYCLLVPYEKNSHLNLCCLFCPKNPKLYIAATWL